MHLIAKLIFVLLLVIFSSTTVADDYFLSSPAESGGTDAECDDSTEDCFEKWAGGVEFGYVAVTGNQDTTSLNARFALAYELEKWRHAGFISVVTSSTEEEINNVLVKTDAEKLTAQAKSDYKFSKKGYAFGIYDYDETKDSGFEYQSSFAAGFGYRFIKNKKHTLDGELGLGSRTSKTEATPTIPSAANTETITRLAGKYLWKISKTSNFEQKLSTEIGDDNTITKSYSGLSANIFEDLALKVSYTIKDQSDVPPDTAKRETITAFTIVYSF